MKNDLFIPLTYRRAGKGSICAAVVLMFSTNVLATLVSNDAVERSVWKKGYAGIVDDSVFVGAHWHTPMSQNKGNTVQASDISSTVFDASLTCPRKMSVTGLYEFNHQPNLFAHAAFNSQVPKQTTKTEFATSRDMDLGKKACTFGTRCWSDTSHVGLNTLMLKSSSLNQQGHKDIDGLETRNVSSAAILDEPMLVNTSGNETADFAKTPPDRDKQVDLPESLLEPESSADWSDLDEIVKTIQSVTSDYTLPRLDVSEMTTNLGSNYNVVDVDIVPIVAVIKGFELALGLIMDIEVSGPDYSITLDKDNAGSLTNGDFNLPSLTDLIVGWQGAEDLVAAVAASVLVPEPDGFAILALGLVLLTVARRKSVSNVSHCAGC
ncbi:hypothetical protein [Neptunicella sp. SCSIO 80796]|uniref:hypothetical protein n=1 Tax=Neptunicella plasticusilytica TaxID=3117012 RepID=UPI003A4D3BE1